MSVSKLLPSREALDRLIYLIGPVRSGTSFLHRAMDIHPNTLVLPGLSYFLQNVWRYRSVIHARLLGQIMRMPACWDEDSIRKRLGPDLYADFMRHVNRVLAHGSLADMYKLYPMAYALSSAFKKDPASVLCWHDKTNDWRGLGKLARSFPACRFIFLFRDPRSVALSAARRNQVKADLRDSADQDGLMRMAVYWRLFSQRCLDFAGRNPERTLLVRYEDYITNPTAALNRVFVFTTGHPLPEAEIEERLLTVKGGATNDPTERYSGVSREPLERWKTALKPNEIEIIETLTAPTACKLGYAIERPHRFAPVRTLVSMNGSRLQIALRAVIAESYEIAVRRPDLTRLC